MFIMEGMVWVGKMALTTASRFLGNNSVSASPSRTSDQLLPWNTEGSYGGWWGPLRFDESTQTTSKPIIFVHGKGNDADDWTAHAPWFSASGYEYGDFWGITFQHPISRHEEMAEQLDSFIRRVREFADADTVDIVSHSLGVTGARHWMHTRDRYSWVDTFVGLAGANHGVPAFSHLELDSFEERQRDVCRYLDPTNEDGVQQLNSYNVPQSVTRYTIRGVFDHYFMGDIRSPRLEGAEDNVVLPVSHNGTRIHPSAMRHMERMVAGASARSQV